MRQGIGHYIQLSLLVQNRNEQLINPFKPTCLTSTKVCLHKYMQSRFLLSIYGSRYTIYVISPLDIRLVYRQQLFLAPTIVAFPPEHTCYYGTQWGVNHHHIIATIQPQLHPYMHQYQSQTVSLSQAVSVQASCTVVCVTVKILHLAQYTNPTVT